MKKDGSVTAISTHKPWQRLAPQPLDQDAKNNPGPAAIHRSITTMWPPRLGALRQPDGSTRWRVWAPKINKMDLVLHSGSTRQVHPMIREDNGYFCLSRADIQEGQRYTYSLNNKEERPDPASRWQPEGVDQPSAVLDTGRFIWNAPDWRGIDREDLVFYELHVGTFTPEGTFEAIIPRLVMLRDLGVTALEIMPIGQFPGDRNWGYDGVHPFAPQNSYGGPQGFQRLVDACHAHGLAVILDVVYNHIGPEGGYLNEYGPFFTERYRTPWGAAVNYDDQGSDSVREFIIENARMWIEDYRVDGLRMDAVHAIFDFNTRHILQEVKETADQLSRTLNKKIHIIAESDLNDVRLLQPPAKGGYGLDAQWNDDFHHTVHAMITGERQGYYQDYGEPMHFKQLLEKTFVLDGCYSTHRGRRHGGPDGGISGDHFVVCIQNHDQVGNRACGERLDELVSPAARRLAASLLLLAPHLPLLFMGEEYGEPHPFLYFCSFNDPELIRSVQMGRRREFEAFHAEHMQVPDPQARSTFVSSRLTWNWQNEWNAALRRLYRDLLHARRSWPALRDYKHRSARLLPDEESGTLLEMIRGREGRPRIRALFNLSSKKQNLASLKTEGLIWSSESGVYGGARRPETAADEMLPFECMVFGAARDKRT